MLLLRGKGYFCSIFQFSMSNTLDKKRLRITELLKVIIFDEHESFGVANCRWKFAYIYAAI